MIYVVTGNAYPVAVFKMRKDADAFAKSKRENKDKPKASLEVTWDVKEFKLR